MTFEQIWLVGVAVVGLSILAGMLFEQWRDGRKK